MEPTILIVEDSIMYGKLLERNIINNLGYRTVWLRSYIEVKKLLKERRDFTLAILDYRVTGALDGEVIDLCLKASIPSVVISSDFSDDTQEYVWSKNVIDYIVKEGAHSVQYLLDLTERIVRNAHVGILVVDDSKVARTSLRQLLAMCRFKVYEACDGLEALDILEQNSDIKLVLTDYNMPNCDGFELTRRLRHTYPMDRLGIIGLSSKGNLPLTIKFIKYGANDFLNKPYIKEMLFCRINQNLKLVEHFETIRQVSLIDHLTNINNRRYLFEAGDIIFEDAMRNGNMPVVAMLDIDDFKVVNDTFGHPEGDKVLRAIAETLNSCIRKSDILSRYGGEEFCIVCRNIDREQAPSRFEKWKDRIGELKFRCGEQEYSVTISIGLCLERQMSFQQMLKAADEKLYQAKQDGKNRVCW